MCLPSVVIAFFIIASCTSCLGPKQVRYVDDIPDSTKILLPQVKSPSPVVQPDDILEIKFTGADDALASDYNTKGGSYIGNGSTPNYLVDANGDIEIYLVGKVRVVGFTLDSLKDDLKKRVSKYLRDVNVSVRFTSFRFSVIGEVKNAANFNVPNEKVTILEALGYAGDMTQYAKRDKVRVIRDSSGFREIGEVNFLQKTLFTSPYFYLKRNDVILVDGDSRSKQANDVLSRTSILIGIFSSLLTLALFFIKK
jgi:polysaccharide export outer membrane protein